MGIKNHVVLFESKRYGWIAYSAKAADAKRLIYANKHYDLFYIFECEIRQDPYTMKLRAPLANWYNCKRIIKYKDEHAVGHSFMIVRYEDEDDMVFNVTMES